MKKVFVVVSDVNYLPHTKSIIMNVIHEGKWDGDICIISNNIEDRYLTEFEKLNVKILHRIHKNSYKTKLYLFDVYFKQWDYVMFMDCDFMVFNDLNKFFTSYNIDFDGIFADAEPFKIHQYFCQNYDEELKSLKLGPLKNKYNLDKFGFNSGFIFFNTKIISDETLIELFKIDDDTNEINNHVYSNGSDQPILNLYFIDKIKNTSTDDICYWTISNENTLASHFIINKPWENDDFSKVFNKTYKEKYQENLDKFLNYKINE